MTVIALVSLAEALPLFKADLISAHFLCGVNGSRTSWLWKENKTGAACFSPMRKQVGDQPRSGVSEQDGQLGQVAAIRRAAAAASATIVICP